MDNVNLLLVDDHQMLLDGVKSLLRKNDRFQVVDEALSAESGLAKLRSGLEVDIVITDIGLTGMNGLEFTKMLKKDFPELKVLVLSMHDDRGIISEILEVEADGYILKNSGKAELVNALQQIADNSTYYSREVLQIMMQNMRHEKQVTHEKAQLTEREVEVLKLICEELSSQQIAERLFISKRTVDTHRQNILEKTDCKTLVGLIKFALRNELTEF